PTCRGPQRASAKTNTVELDQPCEIAGSVVRNCRASGEHSVEPGVRLPLVGIAKSLQQLANANNAGRQEGRDVEFLPNREVVADNDGDLGREHAKILWHERALPTNAGHGRSVTACFFWRLGARMLGRAALP